MIKFFWKNWHTPLFALEFRWSACTEHLFWDGKWWFVTMCVYIHTHTCIYSKTVINCESKTKFLTWSGSSPSGCGNGLCTIAKTHNVVGSLSPRSNKDNLISANSYIWTSTAHINQNLWSFTMYIYIPRYKVDQLGFKYQYHFSYICLQNLWSLNIHHNDDINPVH